MALEPDNNHIAIAGLETERSGHLHKSTEADIRKTQNMKVNENYHDFRGSVALKYNHHSSTSNQIKLNQF